MAFKELYVVKDEKANSFGVPQFFNSVVETVRAITVVSNDPASMLGRFPDDYSVYYVGRFEDVTGALDSSPPVLAFTVASTVGKLGDKRGKT